MKNKKNFEEIFIMLDVKDELKEREKDKFNIWSWVIMVVVILDKKG